MRSWREFDCSNINRTQRAVWMLNGGWQTDSRSRERSLRELGFNDSNIHLYLRLNYGTASEHFKYSARKLYGALWCFCGFCGAFVGNNNTEQYTHNIGFGLVSSDRYPIQRKWPDWSRYRSWVSDRWIPTKELSKDCWKLKMQLFHQGNK